MRSLVKNTVKLLPLPIYSKLFRKFLGISFGNDSIANKEIELAAVRLQKKLEALKIEQLKISDYSKRYLSEIQGGLKSCLTKFQFVLSNGLERTDYRHNFSFLEYGGGTGILTLLAAELGISKVTYNDIYDVSCEDFKVTSQALGFKNISVICGDVSQVSNWSKKENQRFDLIGSYDVLEHIYDPAEFFKAAFNLLSPSGRILMASGANSYNLKVVAELSTLHERIETEDREKVWGHKERDALKSYLKIRKEIISELLRVDHISVTSEELDSLALRTRGLTKELIRKNLIALVENKALDFLDSKFPSSTCDPLTGNWAEHLIDFEKLKAEVQSVFGNCQIIPVSVSAREASSVIAVLASIENAKPKH